MAAIGFRHSRKKTNKQLEASQNSLEEKVEATLAQYAQRFDQFRDALNQALQIIAMSQRKEMLKFERYLEVIDVRSLALCRLLEQKNHLTQAEQAAMAEFIRIEQFEKDSQRDSEQRNLKPFDGPVGEGTIFTMRVTASDPVTNQKIEELSLMRSKIDFGDEAFPKDFFEGVRMTLPGGIASFKMTMPDKPHYGIYAGKEVVYLVEVLSVLKPENPPAPAETPTQE